MPIEGNVGARGFNTQPVGMEKVNPVSNANKDANAGASTLTAMMQGGTKVTASLTDSSASAVLFSAPVEPTSLKKSDPLKEGNKAKANQLYSEEKPKEPGAEESEINN